MRTTGPKRGTMEIFSRKSKEHNPMGWAERSTEGDYAQGIEYQGRHKVTSRITYGEETLPTGVVKESTADTPAKFYK